MEVYQAGRHRSTIQHIQACHLLFRPRLSHHCQQQQQQSDFGYFRTQGAEQDRIIYISKVYREDNKLKVSEIIDDNEWAAVLQLLKNIANAK